MECERTHDGVVVVWWIASINAIRGWSIGKDLLMETAMTGTVFSLINDFVCYCGDEAIAWASHKPE